MKKYKYLIFDLDETLLDFKRAEKNALKHIFKNYNIPFNKENYDIYHEINHNLWSQLEKQEITKSDVLERRFESFFKTFGYEVNGKTIDEIFRQHLAIGNQLFPQAKEILLLLKEENFTILAGTNGVGKTQRKRLRNAEIYNLFEAIYISEEIGFAKPSRHFFEPIFKKYPDMSLSNTLMIGDSLTSDIQGACNIGIDSIWINAHALPHNNMATYEIKSIDEIIDILIN